VLDRNYNGKITAFDPVWNEMVAAKEHMYPCERIAA